MNWTEFSKAALDMGFARAYSVSTEPFARWGAVTKADPNPKWSGLHADPRELMPNARSLVILLWTYAPYASPVPGEVTLHAYYTACQAAYFASERAAGLLRDAGYEAISDATVPVKPALLRTGEALYGRNGVTAIRGLGSRYRAQVILTDAPFPAVNETPESEIDPRCGSCGACIRTCPVSALKGTSRVDVNRCLRAISYAEEMPVEAREKIGACLLGCDFCQAVCPRNAGIAPVPMPSELREVLSLPRLLTGDTKELGKWIGANYARPMRIAGRAAILAANLGRTDCAPYLRKLLDCEFAYVREHARWALERLGC